MLYFLSRLFALGFVLASLAACETGRFVTVKGYPFSQSENPDSPKHKLRPLYLVIDDNDMRVQLDAHILNHALDVTVIVESKNHDITYQAGLAKITLLNGKSFSSDETISYIPPDLPSRSPTKISDPNIRIAKNHLFTIPKGSQLVISYGYFTEPGPLHVDTFNFEDPGFKTPIIRVELDADK